MLLIDGAGEAILGYVDTGKGPVAVYCYDRLVKVFEKQFEEDGPDAHEAALERVEFNILGAYLGDGTPLILYPADRDRLDEVADEHASED